MDATNDFPASPRPGVAWAVCRGCGDTPARPHPPLTPVAPVILRVTRKKIQRTLVKSVVVLAWPFASWGGSDEEKQGPAGSGLGDVVVQVRQEPRGKGRRGVRGAPADQDAAPFPSPPRTKAPRREGGGRGRRDGPGYSPKSGILKKTWIKSPELRLYPCWVKKKKRSIQESANPPGDAAGHLPVSLLPSQPPKHWPQQLRGTSQLPAASSPGLMEFQRVFSSSKPWAPCSSSWKSPAGGSCPPGEA